MTNEKPEIRNEKRGIRNQREMRDGKPERRTKEWATEETRNKNGK